MLGAKQVHPVLLASLGKLSTREKERLLRLFEVLIVRYQLIGGGRTGRLEIACAALAYSIWKGDVTTASDAMAKVSDILPSDAEFRTAFESKIERNNRKATYMLARLERQKRQGKKGVAAVELDPSETLTVEHILPRNAGNGVAGDLGGGRIAW